MNEPIDMRSVLEAISGTVEVVKKLHWKIKFMSDEEFKNLLIKCDSRDQILYAVYFRYF